MRAAGGDVVQEELAVEDDVVAGEEGLDPGVDLDAGFLPEKVGHVGAPELSRLAPLPHGKTSPPRGIPASSGSP